MSAEVVEDDGAVRGAGGEERAFDRVEGEGCYGVCGGGPVEGLEWNRGCAFEVVDLDCAAGDGEVGE